MKTIQQKMQLYCDGCKWLYPNEKEQNNLENKPHHRCRYYGKRVCHYGHRPHIVRLLDCKKFMESIGRKDIHILIDGQIVNIKKEATNV